MTAKIRESKGGQNPPVKCGEKILQYCSSQFILESLEIKTFLSTTCPISSFVYRESSHRRKSAACTKFDMGFAILLAYPSGEEGDNFLVQMIFTCRRYVYWWGGEVGTL